MTGRVWQINLPDLLRLSDDGQKLYALLAQLGRRQPIPKKSIREASGDDMPDSECPTPVWQRQPVRVTFAPSADQKLMYSVGGHAVNVVKVEEEEAGME